MPNETPGISDPILNCITEVCCGPQEALRALAKAYRDYCPSLTGEQAKECAEVTLNNFDLMPKGSCVQLKADISRLARG